MKSLLSSQNELKSDQVSRSKDQSIAHQGLRGKKDATGKIQNLRNRTNDLFFFFFFQRKRKKFKKKPIDRFFRDIKLKQSKTQLVIVHIYLKKGSKKELRLPRACAKSRRIRPLPCPEDSTHAMRRKLSPGATTPAPTCPRACSARAATAMKVCTVTRGAAPAKWKPISSSEPSTSKANKWIHFKGTSEKINS